MSPHALLGPEELTFAHDALGRKPFADRLDSLISDFGGELVVCLDAPWGEGKTTFVKMWMKERAEKKAPYIYIDAYANDQAEDPFVVVASEIVRFARLREREGQGGVLTEMVEALKRNSGRVVVKTGGVVGRALIRATTLGVLDEKAVTELASSVPELIRTRADELAFLLAEEIETLANKSQVISEYRDALSRLAEEVTDSGQPLVVVVDELDRCSPSFSIRLLERVKHLFSVPGVVFVLVADRKQLRASVCHFYGERFDSHGYLQKFFHLNCSLPKRKGKRGDYLSFAKEVLKRCAIAPEVAGEALEGTVHGLAEEFGLTLRELERVVLLLSIYHRRGGFHSDRWQFSVPLAMLKVRRPGDYERFSCAEVSLADLRQVYPELFSSRYAHENYAKWCSHYFRWALATNDELNGMLDDDDIQRVVRGYHGAFIGDRGSLIPSVCRVLDYFGPQWD